LRGEEIECKGDTFIVAKNHYFLWNPKPEDILNFRAFNGYLNMRTCEGNFRKNKKKQTTKKKKQDTILISTQKDLSE
jgi:hypothetical protein